MIGAFDGRSDCGPFTAVGIPAGGLFTGAEDVKSDAEQAAYGGTAGEAFDPCYHKACDDIENISVRGLNQMSDAVADAVNHFAFSLDFIPRPNGGGAAKAKAGSRKGTNSKVPGRPPTQVANR